jgi:NADPH2:quinone reductase
MRAVLIRRFGDPDGMEVVDLADPVPGPGRIMVRTEAVGVGGVDAVIRRGALAGYGFRAGFVPGGEVAGTVASVGAGVDPAWLGRRVWVSTGTAGGYAELAVADVQDAVVLPARLTSVDAVALGSAAPVAYFALRHAHLTAGESVLVRGAAGSIGIAAVELAARAGASAVAVTASSPERGRRLRDLGATHVLDRNGDGEETTPSQFDVILDIVSGALVPAFIGRLAPNGRMVAVGVVGGQPPADFGTALLGRFQQSLSYSTFSLATTPRSDVARARADLFDAAVQGRLHAVVHDLLPLEHAADAHRRMDAGEVFGRIVLAP